MIQYLLLWYNVYINKVFTDEFKKCCTLIYIFSLRHHFYGEYGGRGLTLISVYKEYRIRMRIPQMAPRRTLSFQWLCSFSSSMKMIMFVFSKVSDCNLPIIRKLKNGIFHRVNITKSLNLDRLYPHLSKNIYFSNLASCTKKEIRRQHHLIKFKHKTK